MAALVEESDGAEPRPARRRLRRAAVALLALLAVALAALWVARRPIAGRAIDRELARAGVPARYEIERLEFGRQRLRDVVIGDPARPDLVADWVETGTRLSLSGATVTAVRAGRVRLRGRLVDGRVSFGAIDRLLPPPSGKPFALPRLFADVADARIRLETPAGTVGFKLAGRGRLDDGFEGRLAAVSPALRASGCEVRGMRAAVRVRIDDASPRLVGPVRADAVECEGGGARPVATTLDATLGPALDRWRGSARLATGAGAAGPVRLASLAGTASFRGDARATAGELDLAAERVVTPGVTAGRAKLAGDYLLGREIRFDGRVGAERASARGVRVDTAALGGTPLGPIAARVAEAVERAARGFAFDARVAVDAADQLALRVTEARARSASGARVRIAGGDGVSWSSAGLRIDGEAQVGGGGLPSMRVSLDQTEPGGPIRGLAQVAAYRVGGASLALTPVSFSATPSGATRVATTATLSGPLGDGRVDGLSMPLTILWDGAERFTLNPGCAPASFRRLAVAGLTLAPAQLSLCPVGPALARVEGGRVSGGARLTEPRLTGRLGSTPVTLAASGGEARLGDRGFSFRDVAARLGSPGRVTRLDLGRLEGRLAGGVVAGRFGETGGQIANVPLMLSEAAGAWRLAGGTLTLEGGTTVSDAAGRRFEPLRSEDVTLRLASNQIAVTGSLLEPATRARVADVRIAHDLSRDTGQALLDVPGVTFDERLQPEALTRVLFGVIADVRGAVRGQGRIAWSPEGVTSTGAFRTDRIDLAAAFGPVQGLKGEIRFDDLLALRSAPGQVVTVASINPGVPVTDGVIRYQTLPDSQVQVESGRWPFAGGSLTLRPTLLDFSEAAEKRLTFEVTGMDAGQFLQQFEFENLNATGVFDGVLPMVFDVRGGRIEGGRLTVRPGGGTLSYVGTLTQEQLGFWGDLAFQALKSIRYRSLGIVMDGPLAGEMVTQVRFAGVSQGEGAKSNFLIRRLQRLPFVFNIRITAPFRGLIDSAQGFYDPRRLIQRNLPALLEDRNRRRPVVPGAIPTIQPPASRNTP